MDGDTDAGSGNVGGMSSCGNAGQSSSSSPATPPQQAHIAVHVQTSASLPVQGATVSVAGLPDGTTDASGNWDFGDVPPGQYTASGTETGYVPDVASLTKQAPAGVDTGFVLTLDPVEFHMHVDADRDGKVDADRTGIGKWEWGKGKKGAIIFCNNDDDEPGASACDNADSKVNAGNDGTELAPIEIRRIGPPPTTGWEGFLEVAVGQEEFFHLFESSSPGSPVVLGKGKANSYKLPDLNFTTKQLWIEGTQYADSTFSGEFTLTFRLNRPGGSPPPENARFRVAPWIMPSHLDSATKVFVVDAGPDNDKFRGDLRPLVTTAGCTLQEFASPDIWMQDCMEIGFSNLPAKGFPAVLRASRENFREHPPGSGILISTRPLKNFPKTLLTADFGYLEEGPPLTTPHDSSSFDSTGNLECTPPVTSKAGKKYPFGRMYYGPGGRGAGDELNADVKEFLNKQIVQSPIEIDTNWLSVGHVDEIITIVPAPGALGFRVLLASPKLAYKILNDNKAANGAAKMLVGRKFPDVSANSAEVTITDFLDVGIPSVHPRCKASSLKPYNDDKQARLDAVRTQLTNELGLGVTDIIDVPVIFADLALIKLADALTAGMVNMLVINKHCIVPKPFGPIVGGKDLFEEDLKGRLTPLGLTVDFIDDWFEYHVNQGEVHCGTNTLRTTTSVKWWEFTP